MLGSAFKKSIPIYIFTSFFWCGYAFVASALQKLEKYKKQEQGGDGRRR